MSAPSNQINPSALYCISIISRLHACGVDSDHLRHQFAPQLTSPTPLDLSRVLSEIDCKSTTTSRTPESLHPTMFPAIAGNHRGEYFILAKRSIERDAFLVQRHGEVRATWVSRADLYQELTGELILVKKQAKNKSPAQFGLSWFFRASFKYRSILRDCFLASLFVQFFALASPLIFMLVIDKVLSHNSLSTLDVLVVALLVISIFEILLNTLRAYLLSHTANRLDLTLGIAVFRHMLTLPLSYFSSRQVGDTIARLRELETVRQFITGSGLMLLLDLVFLTLFICVMLLFSPFLTLLVLLAMPFLFAGSFLLTPLLRDRLEHRYATNADNQSFLVETISGIETIKAAAAEPRVRDKWEERLSKHVKTGFNGGILATLINQVTAIVSKTLTVLLLWFGAREVLKGNLTVGQLIAFNMLSSRVIAPLLRLSQITKEYQQTRVAVARIGDILNCPGEPGFDPGRSTLPKLRGEVRFDHVTFRYNPESAPVLQDISFSVRAGEVIGVIGSSGSGKTTLAKLLQRLYVPEQGRIFVDGADLALADASWLRRQTGVVVQDSVLFNCSIRENICLNAPDLELEAIMRAAELAVAHEFILDLPEGYDTLVGERGLILSTGQRQRLAIARAIATNPRMLILDEATSALDYASEQRIQDNMQEICAGRTVFIIAHRFSTLRHVDRILTLEEGKIIEDGSPKDLLASDGRYASLHRIEEACHA